MPAHSEVSFLQENLVRSLYRSDNVGVQKDFTGFNYEYVSTEKGMSQQKCYMPKKSKKWD